MLKKFIFVSLLLSSMLAGTVFCQELLSFAMSVPVSQQDGRSQDSPIASAASQSPMTLDRSGMDKASVHLQILQQSTMHFSESGQAKKPTIDDKKSPIKLQSNS
jgi:hypothetical protein